MSTPADILDELEGLNLEEIVEYSLQEVSAEYVRKNLDQLYEGMGSDGQKIVPQYRRQKYARAKNEMNPTPGFGTPDLFLTGEFYRQTEAKIEGGDLVEESSVEYAKKLEEQYGDDQIWGLDEENHDEFVNEDLQPLIIEKIMELTGLS